MTTKQRAYLRGKANDIESLYQIGKSGTADNLLKTLDDALKARELIKITVLETCPSTPREISDEICPALNCFPVQVIGRKLVIFRQKKKDSAYTLPR